MMVIVNRPVLFASFSGERGDFLQFVCEICNFECFVFAHPVHIKKRLVVAIMFVVLTVDAKWPKSFDPNANVDPDESFDPIDNSRWGEGPNVSSPPCSMFARSRADWMCTTSFIAYNADQLHVLC